MISTSLANCIYKYNALKKLTLTICKIILDIENWASIQAAEYEHVGENWRVGGCKQNIVHHAKHNSWLNYLETHKGFPYMFLPTNLYSLETKLVVALSMPRQKQIVVNCRITSR